MFRQVFYKSGPLIIFIQCNRDCFAISVFYFCIITILYLIQSSNDLIRSGIIAIVVIIPQLIYGNINTIIGILVLAEYLCEIAVFKYCISSNSCRIVYSFN